MTRKTLSFVVMAQSDRELLVAFDEATRAMTDADAAKALGVSESTVRRWRGYVRRDRYPRSLSRRYRAALEGFLRERREGRPAGATADFVAGVHHATYLMMQTVNRLRQAQGLPSYPPIPGVHLRPPSDLLDHDEQDERGVGEG